MHDFFGYLRDQESPQSLRDDFSLFYCLKNFLYLYPCNMPYLFYYLSLHSGVINHSTSLGRLLGQAESY